MTKIKAVEHIESLITKGMNLLSQMEARGRSPENNKKLMRRWNLKETSEEIGRSVSSIQKAQITLLEQGLMDPLEKHPQTGRLAGYTLRQLNQLRKHFGKFPHRSSEVDECLVLAIQSFKGGVGKTVTSLSVAQYLATQGYRILFVDMDSQASATSTFGYIPDTDIAYEETLMPFFKGDQTTLDYCIRETYWEGLDLIPANLQLYELELSSFDAMKNMSVEDRQVIFSDLAAGLNQIKHKYDIIIIDSPPALGITSLNILFAADALIIPLPPGFYEFSSTLQYLNMIRDILNITTPDKTYKFIKILLTNVTNHFNHKEMIPKIREVYGQHLLQNRFYHTSEVGNAAIEFQTALEVRRPQKRALDIINKFCEEIEIEIVKTWPSKKNQLTKNANIIIEETEYA